MWRFFAHLAAFLVVKGARHPEVRDYCYSHMARPSCDARFDLIDC
jgi:hypothetical protein